jgi:rod shape-determining protein MreD
VRAGRTSISSHLTLILLALALAESSWGRAISITSVHPDLVLVAVIGWTLLRGTTQGLIWAVIGGLCLDLFSGGPFGLTVIPLVAVSLLARLGHSRVFGAQFILPLVLTFPFSVVYYLVYTSLLYLLGRPIEWTPALTHVILPASLLNIGAMLLLFPLLRWLHRRTGPEQMTW